ncbi:monovalent cation:proton antiporter-2 (CPA2) family protein [Pseudoalteromonas ruthenica]|uniref:Potassium transporter n=1 Tax=Pseudoalteromonas ruthenica TaxID=151081 RepID=A0A0F4PYC4_9GAMM|nr:monovalent cation:proton antiporter-2 (CPA2) family protein [Pseudoalteromonas ruthenica]KJY97368.1 potassium transporter [Pseudoalteromonas ruthenica]KJY99316.1 potassium transporter [Pseudoalteromonas ruthenica]TMO86218.1 potassium transporter [Pseudoalteromonas ruthenica]TMO90955.1 potassium transporter [Pseudoalteromonas ruthenica]TMO98585.1 potassium transporter [Pseudoalteromonas ruthenica]
MLLMALIYLGAAIIAVPLAKRLGLGSVLGYLLAGILIGPYALGLVGDQTEVMHFAEFGVVMMLFLVGLELHPARLWRMRHAILGLGGLQVTLTAAVLFALCYWLLPLPWQSALAIGLMLALSSTAIVLQSLEEKGWLRIEAGQNAFSVLLFQDIAVIPMLALLPLLAFAPTSAATAHSNLIQDLPVLAQVGISTALIAAIILAGKYVSAPLFRFIAETRMREIFTVFALFLVVAIALLMQLVGLSPALGTFLAGVVLAESDFRHELEADIEPFKGLLLGLFFVAVGANIDFALLADNFADVLLMVLILITVKAVILFALAHIFKLASGHKLLFTLALAQGGEFAFVLLTTSSSLQILTTEQVSLVTLVVAISMLMAPLLLILYERLQRRSNSNNTPAYDKPEHIAASKNVIIAGYGRFGQVIGRLLSAQGYDITVLDHSPSQIELLRRFGTQVFYGDAGRKELLDAAGAEHAQMLVIAIDDADKTLTIIELAKKHYPHLKLVARARDRRHAYQLIGADIDAFNRETVDSAINLAVESLQLLGNSEPDAQRAGELFRNHDRESLLQLAELWGDDHSYGVAVRQRMDDLKHVLAQDKQAQQKLNTCDNGDC